jgi:lia operon protein LiaG
MKRFLIIVICVMLAAFGVASLLWAVGGQGLHFGDWENISFDVGDTYKYTTEIDVTEDCDAGDASSIRIETISAPIHIVPAQGDTLTAHLAGTFSSSREIDPPTLELTKNGGSIRVKVKYPKLNLSALSMNSQLTLTVSLPVDFHSSLALQTVSGSPDTVMPLTLSEFKFDSVSGDLDITDVTAGRVDLGTTSGRVSIDVTGCDDFTFHSISGDLIADTDAARAEAATTSGRIRITGLTGSLTAQSISGDINAAFDTLGDVQANDTSGSVTLQVPAGSTFSLDFSTVSGDFRSDFPITLTESSRMHIKGSAGEGGPSVDVQTVSGNLRITD